ncbi:MAG: ribosome recycling factor [Gammaproteobacteria bacterium]|nr:ribosome recycling factor [Gammaproteobacteria bacterium]
MVNALVKDTEQRMLKCIDALKLELTRIRTGRANTGIIEHIKISYYGNDTPLTQVANIAVEDARTLTVTPWEKNMVPTIEKAILNADLGLNPVTAGSVIRVPLPQLTEQRRKELIKIIRDEGEKSKVAVRNIRRDSNTSIKDSLKAKTISEDDERRAEAEIQKVTDKYISEIDKVIGIKEADLLEI